MKQWILKRLRDENNLSQKEFAEKVGISYHSYIRKENGQTPFLDYEMYNIKEFFDKPIEEIFLFKDCNDIAVDRVD